MRKKIEEFEEKHEILNKQLKMLEDKLSAVLDETESYEEDSEEETGKVDDIIQKESRNLIT